MNGSATVKYKNKKSNNFNGQSFNIIFSREKKKRCPRSCSNFRPYFIGMITMIEYILTYPVGNRLERG